MKPPISNLLVEKVHHHFSPEEGGGGRNRYGRREKKITTYCHRKRKGNQTTGGMKMFRLSGKRVTGSRGPTPQPKKEVMPAEMQQGGESPKRLRRRGKRDCKRIPVDLRGRRKATRKGGGESVSSLTKEREASSKKKERGDEATQERKK